MILLVPKFNEAQMESIVDIFKRISSIDFPSLVKQFTLLTPPQLLSNSLKKRLTNAFGANLIKLLGKGFKPRELLDRKILESLG